MASRVEAANVEIDSPFRVVAEIPELAGTADRRDADSAPENGTTWAETDEVLDEITFGAENESELYDGFGALHEDDAYDDVGPAEADFLERSDAEASSEHILDDDVGAEYETTIGRQLGGAGDGEELEEASMASDGSGLMSLEQETYEYNVPEREAYYTREEAPFEWAMRTAEDEQDLGDDEWESADFDDDPPTEMRTADEGREPEAEEFFADDEGEGQEDGESDGATDLEVSSERLRSADARPGRRHRIVIRPGDMIVIRCR